MSKVETYQQEIMDAIEDAKLMFHDQAREIERLKYARFADSDDLELARIHLNTLHLAIAALRAQIEPGEPCYTCQNAELLNCSLGCYEDEFAVDVNYCPECGKRLKEDGGR